MNAVFDRRVIEEQKHIYGIWVGIDENLLPKTSETKLRKPAPDRAKYRG